MKIFITGGAGFIGKWLVEKLPVQTEIVIIDSLDKQVHKFSTDFPAALKTRAVCIKADIRGINSYGIALEGSDILVHLAAQTGTAQSMYDISRYIQHNVEGTVRLLELLSTIKKKPKRIILASSRAVYGEGPYRDGIKICYPAVRKEKDLESGSYDVYNTHGIKLKPLAMSESHSPNPVSIYGLTKLWQEQLVQSYCRKLDIDFIIFRFQNVYGPGQEVYNPYSGVLSIFSVLALSGKAIELFEDGMITRDYIYIEDVVSALKKAIAYKGKLRQIVNVGSGREVTLSSLVEIITSKSGKEPNVKISGRFLKGDVRHAVADMSKYEKIFGKWSPKPLENGVEIFLDWLKRQNRSSFTISKYLTILKRKKVLLTNV